MNVFIIIINYSIPIIMISIGIIYRINPYKNINNFWSLIISIAMVFTGFSDGHDVSKISSKHIQNSIYKKYGTIWVISGLLLLIIISFLLITNKSEIKDLSILILELEGIILVALFIILEFFIKRKSCKISK